MVTEYNPKTSEDPRVMKRISRFFYQEEVPYGIAIVRIIMPLVLLVTIIQRWPHAREIFSSDGAPAPVAYGYGYPQLLPEPSGTLAVALFSALGFFLVTSSIGWMTRVSLIASTVLYTYFNMLDSLSTMTKYSVVGSHVLLILSLSQCGAIWSVDSWLKGGPRRNLWPATPPLDRPRSPAWPRRLLQILIAVIYFGSAITKMHTPEFFSGDQLRFWVMTHVNFDHPLGEYMTLFPAVFVIAAYISIIWEVLFLFLVWKGWGRPIMLGMGGGFHLMTNLMLGLYIFPLVSVTVYFAFLNERDLQKFSARLRRIRRKFSALRARSRRYARCWVASPEPRLATLPSAMLFTVLVLLVAFVGIRVEYWMDPYGERRPEGPYALKELDPAEVQKMLAPIQRIRPKDKVLAFDVGTMLFGGWLVDRQYKYQHGESLIAQCYFNPPHEDMWVECNLLDVEERLIERNGQPVPRETLRVNFTYMLNESLVPGDYYLVLKEAGQEVARRRITLEPRLTALGN